MSKRFGGIIGCKYKTYSSWHLNEFPDGSNIGSTVTVYSIIPGRNPPLCCALKFNRHAGTPDKNKTKTFLVHNVLK